VEEREVADKGNSRTDVDEAFDDDDIEMGATDLDDDLSEAGSRPRKGTTARRDKVTPAARTATADQGGNLLFRLVRRFIRFVQEIVAELAKVIWPTRNELVTYTSVVVVFVTVMLTIVGGLDYGFARLMVIVFGRS